MRCNLAQRWHDIRVKRNLLRICGIAVLLTIQSPINAGQASVRPTTDSTSSPDSSTPAGYDLENEASECIGLLPSPDCGKQPQDAGDRGGVMQYLVFAIMISGLAIVGIGIARGIKRQ